MFALWFRIARVFPPKEVRSKYPRAVVGQSGIPFTSSWRKNMAETDVRMFELFRRRFWPAFLFMVAGKFFLNWYLGIVIADLAEGQLR